jgi:hypothetical protein
VRVGVSDALATRRAKNNRHQLWPKNYALGHDALTAEYPPAHDRTDAACAARVEKVMKTILAIAALMFAASVPAGDYKPLQGTYTIGGATLIDPAQSEPQDTHFYVDLEGDAARDLYKALKAKAEAGVCGEAGDLTKRSGGVQCTMVKGGKEYHCAFGVELKTQRIVSGVVC